MHPLVTEFLARQAATGYADLAGTDIRLRLPLREPVVNDFLARGIVASHPSIRYLAIAIGQDNRLDVRVESSAIPLSPRLTLEFIVDRLVSLRPSPTIRLTLQRQRVTRLLAIILPFVSNLLPPEVRWANGALCIDLGMLLQREGLAPLIPFIQSAELESEPGIMSVALHLAIGPESSS
jgi:hypothetical protein